MFHEADYDEWDGGEIPHPDFESTAWGRHRYCCPYCGSDNVLALNLKSIICAAAGGLLGGVITGVIAYESEFDKRQFVTASIVGTLSGVAVGVRFGQSRKKEAPQKVLLCVDCFHFFSTEM